jgi:outer membrane lipoprotein-sorting protein
MRKVSAFALLFLLLFAVMAGCSVKTDSAERVSEYYSGLSSMTVDASVKAEYEDYAVDFELKFSYDSQGKSTVEVKKPVEIEGVKVVIGEDKTTLDYDGASLDVGVPEDTVISPAAVLPELLRVWSRGIVFEQGKEKVGGTDCLLISYQSKHNETEVLYRTWFDASNLKPLKADVFADGDKKISCEFLIAENFK